MTRTWTPAQTAAIETRGRTLLISAAAGAGKTATLTERIIRRLTDPEKPLELSRLLIVTFTRAAAAELRDRIGAALSEAIRRDPGNRYLQRQLISLGSASISTIDAFVREPVKAHFAELGMPAKNRIADEAELAPLRERVMGDLMEAYYIKYAQAPSDELFSLLENNAFADLCDSLTPSKNDEALIPALLALYERLLSFPAELSRLQIEADELEAMANGDFFATSHGKPLHMWLRDFCTSAETALSTGCALIGANEAAVKAYGKAFEADLAFIRELLRASSYSAAYTLLATYQNARLGPLRDASEALIACKEERAELVKAIKTLAKTYFADTPEVVAAQMRQTAQMCRVLYDFLTEYDRRILEEKRARGISDFTDNRRFLLHLLRNADGSPSPLAAELAARYDEVYIDEYQDVDELQDEIFRLIGGNRRFMVGDIKQSIYGFRGADPSVFARYRRDLPSLFEGNENPDGNSIFMSDNFRCDEGVIRVTNAVCGHMLRACPTSVGYVEADDLGFAKRSPSEDYVAPRVEVTVLTKGGSDADEATDEENGETSDVRREADYVAGRIATLLREGTKLASGAPVRPRDIVILMRASTHLAVFREALSAMGIPTGSDELDAREAGRDLLHGGDMMHLVNLLRVIDDPDADIPLSEVLRAPFPGLSLEELLTIRRIEDRSTQGYSLFECLETYPGIPGAEPALCEKVTAFLAWIEHYRTLCTTQPAAAILRFLGRDERCACRDTEAYRYLYESARTCRTATFVSLYAFLRYFEKKLLTTQNITPTGNNEDEWGKVTLMTIHKSKGLEFPVCFVVRCGQYFSAASMAKDLIFEKQVGVAMKLYRRGRGDRDSLSLQTQAKEDTTLRAAAALAVKLSEREEEMRVLYVAMTRARERLCLVGVGNEKQVRVREGDRFATLSCNCYLKWVLAGLTAHPEVAAFCDLQYIPIADVVLDEPLSRDRAVLRSETDAAIADRYRRIRAGRREPTEMEWRLGQVPTKVPASRMSPHMLDTCVFYDTDLIPDEGGKLPDATRADGGSWCDTRTVDALRESLRLMASGNGESNEFELLLNENRRPTAAEKGTAAHLFLQFCDYGLVARHGLEVEIARLAELGYLNARTVAILDRETLQGFFDSRFFARMQSAVRTARELRFNRFVPLSTLTADAAFAEALGDRTLYVQGSIDLLCEFSDGHIEICDYKTDHITDAERADPTLLQARMTERHGEQLRQYAEAVLEMYGKRPTKVYIYSLPLCEAVEIRVDL